MLKKFISSAAAIMLFTATAFAADINVTLNNEPVEFTNQQPVIIEGRTLIPLRGVFEKAGYTIEWDNATKTATLQNDETIINVTANSDILKVNDEEIKLDVPAQNINGSMMLPLRAVGEAANGAVEWDNNTKTASIYFLTTTDYDYIEAANSALMPIQNYGKSMMSTLGREQDKLQQQFMESSNGEEYTTKLTNELSNVPADKLNSIVNDLPLIKDAFAESLSSLNELEPPESKKELHEATLNYLSTYIDYINVYESYLNGGASEEELNKVLKKVEAAVMHYANTVYESYPVSEN